MKLTSQARNWRDRCVPDQSYDCGLINRNIERREFNIIPIIYPKPVREVNVDYVELNTDAEAVFFCSD